MTALLALITLTLIITHASTWAIGITTACTTIALTLDTRATIINRKEPTP